MGLPLGLALRLAFGLELGLSRVGSRVRMSTNPPATGGSMRPVSEGANGALLRGIELECVGVVVVPRVRVS